MDDKLRLASGDNGYISGMPKTSVVKFFHSKGYFVLPDEKNTFLVVIVSASFQALETEPAIDITVKPPKGFVFGELVAVRSVCELVKFRNTKVGKKIFAFKKKNTAVVVVFLELQKTP